MKQNISFFTHYSNASKHPKMQLLIAEYGYEGYGWFWTINERIGESDGCKLDLSKRRNLASLANDLKTSADELEKFTDFLASSDVELIHKQGGIIWTQQTQEDLDRAMKARESAKTRRVGRASYDESETSVDDSDSSCYEMHGQEGQDRTGLEGGEERARSREACAAPDFLPWLTALLRTERNLANPAAFALRVQQSPEKYPDLIDRYVDEHSKPERGSPTQECPSCHKHTRFGIDMHGVKRCPECNAVISEFEDDVPFTAEG